MEAELWTMWVLGLLMGWWLFADAPKRISRWIADKIAWVLAWVIGLLAFLFCRRAQLRAFIERHRGE